MSEERRYLVDVGLQDLPYPMKVASRANPEGQPTIATISISARINHSFEAGWIGKLIHILHGHRDFIGTASLKKNVQDYLDGLSATDVSATFSYPFFIEKTTPVSKEKCRVRYLCAYTAKASSFKPRVAFKIQVPCLTTYPSTKGKEPGELFAQLSSLTIETQSDGDVFPEDLVELVDRKALAPVYSYLSEDDEQSVIKQAHAQRRTSVQVTDDIEQELRERKDISWFSIKCVNYGMLHSYATLIGTEKSLWTPPDNWESMGRADLGI
jgi:GTP cyclohydrolase IB